RGRGRAGRTRRGEGEVGAARRLSPRDGRPGIRATRTYRADGRPRAPAPCARRGLRERRRRQDLPPLHRPWNGRRWQSRLVSEFLDGLQQATVVVGRCVSYGEGISYFPVTEVAIQLKADAGEHPGLAPILGDDEAPSSPDEIAWAFRKLLEQRAADGPVVVVFDDIHWGEPTFLDLVEHIADFSREAPILVLCMARPELLDRRQAWGGGKMNATNVLLEPLGTDETAELLANLLPSHVGDGLQTRILDAAGGNPLFVEEMVAMVAERQAGNGDAAEMTVPPTIQALLAARLDQLDPHERVVLERGSVEGNVFHRGVVEALAPDEHEVP